MTLPRWTVYPALVLIAALVVIAIPRKARFDPYARSDARRPLVILGVDGMDPDILEEVIERFPERMTNFRWLAGKADGIQSLGTSTPPQSPVAWSNFITGMNPGGHGIFDFIHRDPVTRAPAPSTTVIEKGFQVDFPGPYKIDVGADSPANRSGDPFWVILREHGVPADIWRVPANFPVEPSLGVSFSGMMTPALDSAYGECTFFTTNPLRKVQLDYDKTRLVTEYEGKVFDALKGPANPFKDGDPSEDLAFKVYVDRDANAAVIYAGTDDTSEKVVLRPGEWSDFLRMEFQLLPMGMMNMSGVCRFYLRSLEPEIELYASPVNFDPESPPAPVSEPSEASAELAGEIGRYYTQGMAEDVNALKNGVLDDGEFMQQVRLVNNETLDMLDYALDRYAGNGKQGVLFFYFSTIDLACHMMWRHHDPRHPAHDEALARESATPWTGRDGSTLQDTVHDLYLRMDPALGRVRERLGDDITLVVMSDHGFAPYYREFSLNTWLLEQGYLVLKPGKSRELPRDDSNHSDVYVFDGSVDWSKTRAYGIGFNALYLNMAGREQDDPGTADDESGIVQPGEEANALLNEIRSKLLQLVDEETGLRPVRGCALASEVYSGDRIAEAPDLLVGYDAGYGNSDASSTGRITAELFVDNAPRNHGGELGTFNGNHLMDPSVVPGVLMSNRPMRDGQFSLEDITVEILHEYGIQKPEWMRGRPVLE